MELPALNEDDITPEMRQQSREAYSVFESLCARLREDDEETAEKVRNILKGMADSASNFHLEIMLLGPMALAGVIAKSGD